MNILDNLTVAIPTYNRNNYLAKILDSIPKTIKTIVSDNGGFVTREIKESYCHVSFHEQKTVLKMFANWNECVKRVSTKWFIIPSDDDLYLKDAFNIIEYYLEKYIYADIYIFGHNNFDENDAILSYWHPKEEKCFDQPFGFELCKYGVDARMPSIVFRTDLVKQLGAFEESLDFTAADSLLIQKCLLKGNGIFVPHVISSYRVWSSSYTSQKISTSDWLDKIDRWQELLRIFLEGGNNSLRKGQVNRIRDEVFARNLLAGLSNLRRTKDVHAARLFLRQNRYPKFATMKTQLKILRQLF